jgi:hypothetical protein
MAPSKPEVLQKANSARHAKPNSQRRFPLGVGGRQAEGQRSGRRPAGLADRHRRGQARRFARTARCAAARPANGPTGAGRPALRPGGPGPRAKALPRQARIIVGAIPAAAHPGRRAGLRAEDRAGGRRRAGAEGLTSRPKAPPPTPHRRGRADESQGISKAAVRRLRHDAPARRRSRLADRLPPLRGAGRQSAGRPPARSPGPAAPAMAPAGPDR